MLNYDRRLAPSHPKPGQINPRKVVSLRSSLHSAILHYEDHFQMSWAMNVLISKIDEELKANNFDASEGFCGVVHVLHLKSRTTTAIKVGCSTYPHQLFGKTGTVKRYRRDFAPMALKKVEAIHLYQTPRRAIRIEQELHRQLRNEFGNVNPHDLKSKELYKSEHLEAILVRLREIEQRPAVEETQSRPTKKGNIDVFYRTDRKKI